ncbi:MAG: hypothetical protein FWC36_09340 [Spirochaetes bacterium]|nr:hypothetical protein [Spirochaetota bacterium]
MKYNFLKKSVLRVSVIFSFSAFTILLLMILACTTTRPFLASKEPAKQYAYQNGVFVECLYLHFMDMEKRHGHIANPFLPPDLGLTPQQMIVFELTIRNEDDAPIRLDNRQISLFYGGRRFAPMSASDMERKIEEHAERRFILREKRVAQTHMLPSITTIRGNQTVTGYLVFMGGFRDRRETLAELVLPFTSVGGLPVAEFTFTYTLTLRHQ